MDKFVLFISGLPLWLKILIPIIAGFFSGWLVSKRPKPLHAGTLHCVIYPNGSTEYYLELNEDISLRKVEGCEQVIMDVKKTRQN